MRQQHCLCFSCPLALMFSSGWFMRLFFIHLFLVFIDCPLNWVSTSGKGLSDMVFFFSGLPTHLHFLCSRHAMFVLYYTPAFWWSGCGNWTTDTGLYGSLFIYQYIDEFVRFTNNKCIQEWDSAFLLLFNAKLDEKLPLFNHVNCKLWEVNQRSHQW